MTKKNIQLLYIILLSILINFLFAISVRLGQDWKLIFGIFIYFFSGWYILKSKLVLRHEISFWIFISPIFIFQLSSNIIHPESTINSLPTHLIILLSAIISYIFVKFLKGIIVFFCCLYSGFSFLERKFILIIDSIKLIVE